MEQKTMWDDLKAELERELSAALARNGAAPIYLWSLDGEISGRGPGMGWLIQLHFDDPAQPGGVNHVTIGSGSVLDQTLSENLEAWLKDAPRRHPGKAAPRIELYMNG